MAQNSATPPGAAAGDYATLVLLVDDQVLVGEAVRRALADQPDIDFHFCAAPEQALEIARSVKPTIILQDLVMPGIDGMSLVRQYRADPLTQDIPIIVLSSKEEPLVKSEAFRSGANDYLVKLPDPIELTARIRYHSRAYLTQIQRDQAYRALRESQQRLVEMNLELERLNHLDGLTGLSNRRSFDEQLGKEWRRALREQTMLGVMMIDVDAFKPYNDRYGHLRGDEVLKRVGAAIQQCCRRSSDLAARFGGEEFAVVLANTEPEGAERVAEHVRGSVEALAIAHLGSEFGCVTVSVGVATAVPPSDADGLALVEAADLALYGAKKAGRNRVLAYAQGALPASGAHARKDTPAG
jgi:two-component system chemotaxis family response regulator WspR